MSTPESPMMDTAYPRESQAMPIDGAGLWLNRAILVLASIGVYVAGLLSAEKLFDVALPCGTGGGCAQVSNHWSGYWFRVPVAYFGLLGYLAIGVLALLRTSDNLLNHRLVSLGLVLSAVGAVASVWLQYAALGIVRATCPYCLVSAALMITLFVLHLTLFRQTKGAREERYAPLLDRRLALTLPALAALAAVVHASFLNSANTGVSVVNMSNLEEVELIPAGAHTYGSASAPVTIIEFADLGCPTCQKVAPMLKEFIGKHPGQYRLIYRHFLIPSHELSPVAAAMSEVAAEKGRFWDYTGKLQEGMNGQEIHELQPILSAATAAGLEVDPMIKRINNENDPVFARIAADKAVADRLGVDGTPTFFVLLPGQTPKRVKSASLFKYLESAEVKSAIDRAGGKP